MLAPDAVGGGVGPWVVCVCVCWAIEAQELRFLVDGGLAEKGESLGAGTLGAQDT